MNNDFLTRSYRMTSEDLLCHVLKLQFLIINFWGTILQTLAWVGNEAAFDWPGAHIRQVGLTAFTIGLFSGMTAVSLMG